MSTFSNNNNFSMLYHDDGVSHHEIFLNSKIYFYFYNMTFNHENTSQYNKIVSLNYHIFSMLTYLLNIMIHFFIVMRHQIIITRTFIVYRITFVLRNELQYKPKPQILELVD